MPYPLLFEVNDKKVDYVHGKCIYTYVIESCTIVSKTNLLYSRFLPESNIAGKTYIHTKYVMEHEISYLQNELVDTLLQSFS